MQIYLFKLRKKLELSTSIELILLKCWNNLDESSSESFGKSLLNTLQALIRSINEVEQQKSLKS